MAPASEGRRKSQQTLAVGSIAAIQYARSCLALRKVVNRNGGISKAVSIHCDTRASVDHDKLPSLNQCLIN